VYFISNAGLLGTKKACETAILDGKKINTSLGTKKFKFSIAEQLNINAKMDVAQKIRDNPLFAEIFGNKVSFKMYDGEFLYFTPNDITLIYLTKNAHVDYERAYLSALLAWCKTLSDEELSGISYGVNLPDEYKNRVDSVMKPINNLLEITQTEGA